ncbi:MAG: hypothetical protein IJL78_07640 [Lachnospiraceae bacterium]|nr:hypothetical protein [Lachnospiraceae bacterium]
MIWKCDDKGVFILYEGEKLLFRGYALAHHKDGRILDTREAEFEGAEETPDGLTLKYTHEGLVLTETLWTKDGGAYAKCALSSADGAEVKTARLVPLIANGNEPDSIPLWSSLFAKMLLVPYDNDQWNRYEAVPLRVGRKSYDLTVLMDEDTREGLLFGFLDFTDWKNVFIGSHTATRYLNCVSGIADEGTHDVCPHGTLIGKSVESSRLVVLYGSDWRGLLEKYGVLVAADQPPMRWTEGVPFGFNSFAGLARRMSNEIFEYTAKFMREELLPKDFQNRGAVYTNLDGGWQRLPEDERFRIKDEMHAAGQKAGLYDGPFVYRPWPGTGMSFETEIPGFPGHTYGEIMLRDEFGRLLPPVDGLYAIDVTHPLWYEWTRQKFENYKKWGYDYLKIDFLSHGAMEGVHYDKTVRTGRQAVTKAYRFIRELAEGMGYPFFISTSIAPLFPCGYGHARRFCCDTFGTNEYVEYCLNAQTYGWWENHTLYEYNDADHLVLLKSFNVDRDTTLGEAKARFLSGVISGGVMLLSDDFSRPEARERALTLAGNPEVNRIARSEKAFRPVDSNGTSAAHAYTAVIDGKQYLAVFSWRTAPETVTVDAARAGIPAGTYRELYTGERFDLTEGLTWKTEGCDALILEYTGA